MDGMVFFNIDRILVVSLYFTALLPDAESNFPYFKTVSNFSGTFMVHFKAKYRKSKTKYPQRENTARGIV